MGPEAEAELAVDVPHDPVPLVVKQKPPAVWHVPVDHWLFVEGLREFAGLPAMHPVVELAYLQPVNPAPVIHAAGVMHRAVPAVKFVSAKNAIEPALAVEPWSVAPPFHWSRARLPGASAAWAPGTVLCSTRARSSRSDDTALKRNVLVSDAYHMAARVLRCHKN